MTQEESQTQYQSRERNRSSFVGHLITYAAAVGTSFFLNKACGDIKSTIEEPTIMIEPTLTSTKTAKIKSSVRKTLPDYKEPEVEEKEVSEKDYAVNIKPMIEGFGYFINDRTYFANPKDIPEQVCFRAKVKDGKALEVKVNTELHEDITATLTEIAMKDVDFSEIKESKAVGYTQCFKPSLNYSQ